MEEKKKPNNKLTAVVLILVALVGILGGFLVYEITLNAKNDNKESVEKADNKDKSQETKKEKKELSLQDTTVQMLNIRLGEAACIDINPLRRMARTHNVTVNDLTDEEKVKSIEKFFQKEDFTFLEKAENGLDVYKLNYDTLLEKVQMLYGPNVSVAKDKEYSFIFDISSTGSGATAKYDNELNAYRVSFGGIGGACGIALTYAKLESAYTENDTLVLVEKIIAPKMENGEVKVYNNLSYEKVIGTDQSEIGQFKPDEYLKLGSTVTYTFVKDKTGNYYFDHSEIN